MATENRVVLPGPPSLPPSDPTIDALATYLVKERCRALRQALGEAAGLVDIVRGFQTWVVSEGDDHVDGDGYPSGPGPDTGLALQLPKGFTYFERTAEVPIIEAAPTWHHLDEPVGPDSPESPHAAIVREVVEDYINPIRVQIVLAWVATISAFALQVMTDRYGQLGWLRPWSSWTLGFVFTVAVALSLLRHYATRIGGRARNRIEEHDAREAARALRRQFEAEAWSDD